ncbi:endonuclease [Flaviramulus sp. BrNp1-15]|uniref:endonuclease n=1 Tax=Flaviramulus sp. BrNp1-15 TaxID=2916754 RepID=UPI001EE7F153|nr:endonuclease [Flaviramulus sp. BrNp1-15]ULC58884.1 endonuclease [Flaviramulus sp. BrNp1-15]
MKQFYMYVLLFLTTAISFAQLTPPTQLQAYYTDVDFNKTGLDLFSDLATTTTAKHTNFLSYTPGIWEASKVTDEDPVNSANVLLIYGYNDADGNYITDRSRSKNDNGGTAGTDWNREHSFPKSLGSPNLGESGPGSDAHHLRPSDVTMNSSRGNLKFATGSGNAGNVSGNWYPGDEWKGDVARMMMYMYLRYGTQCLPSNVCVGTSNSIDPNMINLLLEWNAADPVSTIEDNRNTYHANTSNTYAQGNRNPFIDNPYLATVIWGGNVAENRWGATPDPDTEAPTVPTNLMASNPTSSTVDLSWTASTDNEAVTAYNVYVDGSYYVSTNSTATSFTVTGLSAETTYQFAVLAVDAANNTSGLSTAVNETTLASAIGSACLSETFESIPSNASNYTTRTWTGDDGGTWTATDARTDQTLNTKSICIRNGNLTSPTIGGGIGSLTVTTQLTFSGSAGTFDVLVNGASVGSIPYSGDNTSSTTTTISDINTTGDITLVLDNQSTSNRVRIDDLSWTCYSTLSLNETNLNKITVYPNPVNGNTIMVSSNETLEFEIFNIIGKRIWKGKTINKSISVESLKTGVYILKLSNGKQQTTKKLIRK